MREGRIKGGKQANQDLYDVPTMMTFLPTYSGYHFSKDHFCEEMNSNPGLSVTNIAANILILAMEKKKNFFFKFLRNPGFHKTTNSQVIDSAFRLVEMLL